MIRLIPLIAAAFLVTAPAAQAGQAHVEGSKFVYTASAEQANSITAVCDEPQGVCWVMDGPRRGVATHIDAGQGPSCSRTESDAGFTRAECPATGVKEIELDLGDGNDLV